MLHHFHDEFKHPQVQGSISAEQLEKLIEYLGPSRFLPAKEWVRNAQSDSLKNYDLCLTFDDNLRSQLDVALPVLMRHNLTAFFFVYTSPLEGRLERLELYRYVRTTQYQTVDQFYDAFFRLVEASEYYHIYEEGIKNYDPSYLSEFPFYSENDRVFRFVRDDILGQEKYFDLMDRMIDQMQIEKNGLLNLLWMDIECLKQLHENGHEIGLHTHTHPTRIDLLSPEEQLSEYQKNMDVLSNLLGQKPVSMSHPNGRYNEDTIKILRELSIIVGFRSSMYEQNLSALEFMREDHANVMRELEIA